MTEDKLLLLPDAPIGNIGEDDELGFDIYSRVLSQSIKDASGPMAIGIYGEWGEGKTSLMQLIKRELDTEDMLYTTVWFNAWRYTKEEHPAFPLAISIVEALKTNEKLIGKVKEKTDSVIGALSSFVSGVKFGVKAKNDFIGEVNLEYDPEKSINKERERNEKRTAPSSVYFNLFRQLEEARLGVEGEKIVVFVDDLDRCMPHHAIELLESIKLIFGLSGFVFVLGVARGVLDSYVQRIYKEEYGISDFDGAAYLDKIIQLSFFIPPHAPRFNNYLRLLVSRVALPPGTGFKDLLELVEITSKHNPRSAISFINNLLIDKEILKTLRLNQNSIPDVNIGNFAVLRAIQKSWRHLLPPLISLRDNCKEIASWKDKDIEEISSKEAANVNEKNLQIIAESLKTDATLFRLLFSGYGREWLLKNNEREFAIHFLSNQRGELVDSLEVSEKGIKVYVSIFNLIDSETVQNIFRALHEAGVSPVTTENTRNHKSWQSAISENIKDCKIFLCFIGHSATQAKISKLELKVAMGLPEESVIQKGIVFLPNATKKGLEGVVRSLESFSITRLTKKEVEISDYRKIMRLILQ